jgi:hypothetical protein
LVEQTLFKVTYHEGNCIVLNVRTLLRARNPWRVLTSGGECRRRSVRWRNAWAKNQSDAMNRRRSRGQSRYIGSAARRISHVLVRRYGAIIRGGIRERFKRAREFWRQFRARDGVRKRSGRIKQIEPYFFITVLRGRRRRRQRWWTRAKRRREILRRRRPGIGATRRRVVTVRRRNGERNLH